MDRREREPGSPDQRGSLPLAAEARPLAAEAASARDDALPNTVEERARGNTGPLIGEAEVRRIAALAHLPLSADDVARFTHELQRILAYVRQLQEVDVTGVPATAHVTLTQLRLRDDDPWPSLSRDEALREAPHVALDGFAVPSFVDDEGSPSGAGSGG